MPLPTPSFRLFALRSTLALAIAIAIGLPLALHAGAIDDALQQVQHDWEVIRYQTPAKERERRYTALAARAHQIVLAHAGQVEPLLWEGTVLASLADERGSIGGRRIAREAKARYEEAIRLAPDGFDGWGYQGLGVLYAKALGWPFGFGNDERADTLLHAALDRSPQGLDANVAYGEFLLDRRHPAEALTYLERALQAPVRAGRQIADAGRREEARALIDKARAQLAR